LTDRRVRAQASNGEGAAPWEPRVLPSGWKRGFSLDERIDAMMNRGRGGMRYLGGLRGAGTLRCKGQDLAPADYELDGYLVPPAGVAGSGEIRTAGSPAQGVRPPRS